MRRDEKYFKATAPSAFLREFAAGTTCSSNRPRQCLPQSPQARGAAQRTVTGRIPDRCQWMLEPFSAQEIPVLVRFGHADAPRDQGPGATRLLQSALYHSAHGAALAATGKLLDAEAYLPLRAASKAPKDAMVVPQTRPRRLRGGDRRSDRSHPDAKGDSAGGHQGFLRPSPWRTSRLQRTAPLANPGAKYCAVLLRRASL